MRDEVVGKGNVHKCVAIGRGVGIDINYKYPFLAGGVSRLTFIIEHGENFRLNEVWGDEEHR